MNRRSYVAACSGLIAAGVAGCSGDDADQTLSTEDRRARTTDRDERRDRTTDRNARETAGQQSGDQVTNRLEVSAATGVVDQNAQEITHVELTVKQAPGAENVDLRTVSMSWVESGGTFQLVHDSVNASGTDTDGRFAVSPFKDTDQSAPVLNSPEDRFTMVLDLGTESFSTDSGLFDQDVATAGFSSYLQEGEVVTLDISPQSGAGTSERLVVPQSLSGSDMVNL